MIFFNFYLTTLAFVNGENNGFTTNDWQEKHIIVYLIDFAWFLPEANFVCGAFEDLTVSDKILKKGRTNYPHHLFGVDDDGKFVSILK